MTRRRFVVYFESRHAEPTCDLHRVALDASRAEMAAVFSGVAARAPLIMSESAHTRARE